MANLSSYAPEWVRDMYEIRGRGLGIHFNADDFDGIELNSQYADYKKNAEILVSKRFGSRVEMHPDFYVICSLFAFADIFSVVGKFKEASSLNSAAEGMADWIIKSYEDPDNPFPFRNVDEASKRKVKNKKNAKLLDVFLKTI